MPPDAAVTRDKLLDAATRLFAARGVNGVSLAEITKAAGQRNASALHYHFGSRLGVLEAILRRHVPVIRERRLELLALARETPPEDVRSVIDAEVRPITELAQRGWRERAYLHIGAELVTGPDRTSPEIRKIAMQTAGPEVYGLLEQRCSMVPRSVLRERFAIVALFIGRAASDRAQLLESGAKAGEHFMAEEEFVTNLIDMIVGALMAPATYKAATSMS